jgi:hypothetical protein
VDFWDVTRLMFRRWYVAVPLTLVTAVATVFMAVAVRPDYQLTSYVQLIPPLTASDALQVASAQNPWNQLGLESLVQAADYATVDQTFLDGLKARHLSTNFSVTVGSPPGGATFEVVGKTEKQTVDSMAMILQKFYESIRSLQVSYGVGNQDLITTERLDEGQNLKRPAGKVKRAIVAIAAVGLLITCGATITVDVVMRRRKRRRAGSVTVSGTVAPGTAPPGRQAPATAPPRRDRDLVTSPARPSGTGGEAAPERTDRLPPAPDDTALIRPIPDDATIVLPIPRDQWRTGDKRGKRR